MDFNIDVRKKQLDNLDQVIASSKERIQSVLNYLGWSVESLEKEDDLVQCPINPHHRISAKKWTEHIETCLIKAEGYDLKSQFLSEPPEANSAQCIYLDRNRKIEVITKELTEKGTLRLAWNGLDPDPRTSNRLITQFSQDERLVFYNYAIANTVGPLPPPEFTTIPTKTSEEKPPTYEELLAQERDSKRRRAKYKSVHINRKNHTEVIREVINGQMEEYNEWLQAQNKSKAKASEEPNGINGDKKEEIERPSSSISRISNSSSSRSTYRNRREPSRDRHRSTHGKDRPRYKNRSRSRSRDRRRNSRDRDRRRSRDRRSKRH